MSDDARDIDTADLPVPPLRSLREELINQLPAFQLRVGLVPVPAGRIEVLAEIGDSLAEFEPRLTRAEAEQGSALELSLTIHAQDLWVAVLTAMAAVTGTGYHVETLTVLPLRSLVM